MPKDILHYTNGEITVIWQPKMCQHSKICWQNLREVFDPFIKPWINMQGVTTDRIIEQVKQCPSGALTFEMNGKD
ncbi:(4Fe-4S)-binding protein [Chitinophagaceae bacterium LWZ2-11]